MFNIALKGLTLSLVVAVWIFGAASVAWSQEKIISVDVAGNQRVEASTVLLQVSSEPGDDYDAATVNKDVKEVFRTGFFDRVTAKRRESADGRPGVALVFEVQEKPGIRKVQLQGNEEISDDTLKEKLSIGSRRFVDERKLRAGIQAAKDYYQEKGYYGTEIDLIYTPVEGNEVDLTFVIEEGEERHIAEVRFEGNEAFSDSDLEDEVKTADYSWWISWLTGSGLVKKEQIENDVIILNKYYLTRGYLDINIPKPTVEESDDGLIVTFKVEEGAQFKFGELSATGDLIDDSEQETLKGVEARPGEIFNVEILRKDAFLVSEKFTDVGFAFANVVPDTRVNRANDTVAVNFRIDKGDSVTVNRVLISGNSKTRDNVIRRAMQINERETFSSSRIARSQQLLQRLGYFEEVTITPERTELTDEVNLNVSVREGNTGTFSAGAGVSSGDGFIVTFRVSERNLWGTGNALTVDVNTGSETKNYILSYDVPRVNDTRWSVGADLLSVERVFDDFDRKQAGGSVSVGYPLWFLGEEYLDDVNFSMAYEFLSVNIDDVEDDAPDLIVREEGSSTSSSVIPKITRNTIDNPLNPTKGSRQIVSVQLAGIGGQEEFWLVQASNTFYRPLWDSPLGLFVFSNRIRFGYGETFNNEDFPLFRRFFPGGINSVRGFESRELGPKDEDGNEFGGSKQLVANFELIFPLINVLGLNGVVFYDAGEAFDDNQGIEIGDLRQAYGWGLRWNSPIAPIRFEIGYPIDQEPGEKSTATHFSFGAPL